MCRTCVYLCVGEGVGLALLNMNVCNCVRGCRQFVVRGLCLFACEYAAMCGACAFSYSYMFFQVHTFKLLTQLSDTHFKTD